MVLFLVFWCIYQKKLSKKVVVRRHFKRNRSLSHTHIPERPKKTTTTRNQGQACVFVLVSRGSSGFRALDGEHQLLIQISWWWSFNFWTLNNKFKKQVLHWHWWHSWAFELTKDTRRVGAAERWGCVDRENPHLSHTSPEWLCLHRGQQLCRHRDYYLRSVLWVEFCC